MFSGLRCTPIRESRFWGTRTAIVRVYSARLFTPYKTNEAATYQHHLHVTGSSAVMQFTGIFIPHRYIYTRSQPACNRPKCRVQLAAFVVQNTTSFLSSPASIYLSTRVIPTDSRRRCLVHSHLSACRSKQTALQQQATYNAAANSNDLRLTVQPLALDDTHLHLTN